MNYQDIVFSNLIEYLIIFMIQKEILYFAKFKTALKVKKRLIKKFRVKKLINHYEF